MNLTHFYQAIEVQKQMPCFDVDPDRLQGIHCISAGKLLTFDYHLEVLSKFPKPLLSVMVAGLVDIIDQILSTWTAVQSEDGVVENTIPFSLTGLLLNLYRKSLKLVLDI